MKSPFPSHLLPDLPLTGPTVPALPYWACSFLSTRLWELPWQSPNCFPKILFLLQNSARLPPHGCPCLLPSYFPACSVADQCVHPYVCSEGRIQDPEEDQPTCPISPGSFIKTCSSDVTSESFSEDVWRALGLSFLRCWVP